MVEDLIENGLYQEALSYLKDKDDERTRYLRLICLIGLKDYQKAKEEGYVAKLKAEKTYYDVVSMYVTALKELREYEEAIDILIEELSMPYIPYQYEVMLNEAYDQILLEKQEMNAELESRTKIFSIEEVEQILKNKNCHEDLLYMALDQLQQLNVRMIMPTIQDYLRDPTKHFFAKTLIMEILIDQQIDEDLEVYKFDQYYDFNPIYSPLVLEQMAYEGILRYLQNGLEEENPTLFLQCVDYLEYLLYAIYPFEIDEDEYSLIAAALHSYIAIMQGIEVDFDELEVIYHCDKDDIEKEILTLERVEC